METLDDKNYGQKKSFGALDQWNKSRITVSKKVTEQSKQNNKATFIWKYMKNRQKLKIMKIIENSWKIYPWGEYT